MASIPTREMKYLLSIYIFIPSAALSPATQHAMPPEFGRKWGTECLNTMFPLPTLLCAGYRVKLFFFYFLDFSRTPQTARTPLSSISYRQQSCRALAHVYATGDY